MCWCHGSIVVAFAQILIYIAQNNGKLTSDSSANTFRLVVWGIQIVVGLVGVALVGKLAVEEAEEGRMA